jgi:hypothetical protein
VVAPEMDEPGRGVNDVLPLCCCSASGHLAPRNDPPASPEPTGWYKIVTPGGIVKGTAGDLPPGP